MKFYNHWGFINKACKLSIASEYEDVTDIKDGLAFVKQYGNWGIISKKNKQNSKTTVRKSRRFFGRIGGGFGKL